MTQKKRYLIVNADDFGQTPGINTGVFRAYEEGIVTSASLMVRWPAAAEAVAFTSLHPGLALGLHVDLGEWVLEDGRWQPVYEVVRLDDPDAVKAEIVRQIDTFQSLTGRSPTHLDSHQHVHRDRDIAPLFRGPARRLRIPLRSDIGGIFYLGSFYGRNHDGSPLSQAITVANLTRLLATLPPGISELGCHPGDGTDPPGMYGTEREQEVKTLCHPQVRAALAEHGIELISFADLSRLPPAPT